MIQNMLTPYIEELKPHFQRGAAKCESYAERIIARLDSIHQAVQSEEFQELRLRCHQTLTDANALEIGQVPMHEAWELELASASSAVAGTVEVQINGRAVFYLPHNLHDTKGGNGLLVPGGADVAVREMVAGAVPVSIFLQFKRQKKVTQPRRTGAGLPQPEVTPTTRTETERHVVGGQAG